MENASKALIIAGAVLLSIILISLGIFVVNKGKEVVTTDNLSETQKQTFNQQFLQYEGTIKGSQVKALIAAVNSSNANSDNVDSGRTIGINEPASKTSKSYPTSVWVSTKSYTVTLSYDNNTGLVNQIDIN